MGVRFPSVRTNVIVNANLVTVAETVIATTPPLNLPLDFADILLLAYFVINPVGASTTSVSWRIRRGTTTAGAQVMVSPGSTPATAGVFFSTSMQYFDTPGAVAGQQYTLTCNQNAATANGTVVDVFLAAFVL
jgi:hypothetical protein